jgi:transposase
MQLKTILNRVEKYKSFVYSEVKLLADEAGLRLEVQLEARANGRPICSGCTRPAPGYDRLKERRFEFVPLWGIAVYFVYALRRVACPGCGIRAERVPWAEGKGQLTTTYQWFLARWAKRLSWSEVAESFQTTWDKGRSQ